ncbi:hypothetical protein GCM10010276_34030 [Streptomyces longisporus]|uniref:Uncharacterized protein n=1 Tax=Streptomyces longisporus TaxID=1948 RepID=A0ABN3LWM8_STRLO
MPDAAQPPMSAVFGEGDRQESEVPSSGMTCPAWAVLGVEGAATAVMDEASIVDEALVPGEAPITAFS